MRRLPRKRYKQLVKRIWEGTAASNEITEIIGKHTNMRDPSTAMMDSIGAYDVFDPAQLPDTLDELLEGLDD